MKQENDFKGYVIPDELMEKIKGCMQYVYGWLSGL